MASKEKIFIDCPFQDKDAVKKEGAKWDFRGKKWYIPTNLWTDIERFNKWKPNGRIYLDCPFSDKDRAKRKGARWDGSVMKWYFVPSKTKTERDFQEWLHDDDAPAPPKKKKAPVTTPKKTKASEKASSHSSQKKRTTAINTNDSCLEMEAATPVISIAALPRINTDMTIAQLQQECRAHDPGIKGISNKSKQWLVDHLGIGSVWISAGASTSSSGSRPAKKVSTKAQASAKKPKQTELLVVKSAASTKKRKAEEGTEKTMVSICTKKKPKNDKVTMENKSITLNVLKRLPRITTSLTIAELNHELHFRDSSITGTSNKNKQWFLDQLGLGSMQISSIDAKAYDLQTVPKVSKSLTIAQLSHELMERNPNQTGLSGKCKAWFLERLCVGSLLVTGSDNSASAPKTKNVEGKEDGAGVTMKKNTQTKKIKVRV